MQRSFSSCDQCILTQFELFRKFVILIQRELGDGHGDSSEQKFVLSLISEFDEAGRILEHALRHCSRDALPVVNFVISKFPISDVVFIVVVALRLLDERFVVEVVILTPLEIEQWESHLAQISLFDDDGSHNVLVETSVLLS